MKMNLKKKANRKILKPLGIIYLGVIKILFYMNYY